MTANVKANHKAKWFLKFDH